MHKDTSSYRHIIKSAASTTPFMLGRRGNLGVNARRYVTTSVVYNVCALG